MKEHFYLIPPNGNLLISVVADLHARDGLEAVKSLKEWEPDIIAILGDLIVRKRPREESWCDCTTNLEICPSVTQMIKVSKSGDLPSQAVSPLSSISYF